MIKGMMGPQHGSKAVFGSAKGGEAQRKRRGKIKTAKLPTSLEELRALSSVSERRPLNPRVRG
jgi:hypothetical protein